jgi:hypothetical protein
MIVNVVPWLQSCAQLFYSTGWPQIAFDVYKELYGTVTQRYLPIRLEMQENGVKLVLACVPNYCVNRDSGEYCILNITIYKPDGLIEVIYRNLYIYGWSGILWLQIYVVNVVTA